MAHDLLAQMYTEQGADIIFVSEPHRGEMAQDGSWTILALPLSGFQIMEIST